MMSKEIKWRFPGNNSTVVNGLDTADMETFKKDSISSLARELCQNSIDAHRAGNYLPVRIEFKSFEVLRSTIPAIDTIEFQIDRCIETWAKIPKISNQLQEMKKQVSKSRIKCLRISDHNTTGLVGVSTNDDSPWRDLIHGSGISDKGSTSGGSKGIGKFAAFVNSYFNTVFYSTVTEKHEVGFEGICKLCSSNMNGTNEKTLGIGYYGSSDMNEPVFEQLLIDDSFSRKETDFGTDIFIIGFKDPIGWKRDIITKILDSFMSAVSFGTLEIIIDDVIIDRNHLKDVVYNEELINKKERKNIISQYLLLNDAEHRYEDVITIDELGEAKLYLIEFDSDNEDMATNGCVMIRYPYMKIRELSKISTLPCSAMCIIGNNKLNSILRDIENPQHTSWEFNRIDDPSKRAEIKAIYDELIDQIRIIITNHLASSDNSKTDIEGAGEFIQSFENEKNDRKGSNSKITDRPTIQKSKIKIKTTNINAAVPDEQGNGVSLDIGNDSDSGDSTSLPEGSNEGSGGPMKPGDNQGKGKTDEDGHILMKHAELRGMSYRFFCVNKKEKIYAISFVSDYDEDEVRLELNMLDDSGAKYPVRIEKCLLGENEAIVENEKSVKFSIKHGEKIKLLLTTDQEELFSGEVKVYAYR